MKDININEMAKRVHGDMPPEIYLPIYRCIERMQIACESPIELMLAAGLVAASELYRLEYPEIQHLVYVTNNNEPSVPSHCVLVNPQCHILKYRVDFVASCGMEYVAIECDGHDFHERTADQAERDRSRDRDLQKCGVDILRFTGREINRSPTDCAQQIIEFLTELVDRAKIRKSA